MISMIFMKGFKSIIYIIPLFMVGCSSNLKSENIVFFQKDKITVQQKLEKIVQTNYLQSLGLDELQINWMQEFYSERLYNPIWCNDTILNTEGREMKNALSRSLWFGIPSNRLKFEIKSDRIWLEEEVLITAKLAIFLSDIRNGFFDYKQKKYTDKVFISKKNMNEFLKSKPRESMDAYLLSQGLIDSNYINLSRQIHQYCKNYPLDTSTFSVSTSRMDSIKSRIQATQAFFSKGYIKTKSPDNINFTAALKLFQEHNGLKPDGIIGKYTVIALNESTYSKILRASLALDKLRRKKTYPSKCIRINIPEYLLRFYVKDSLKSIHRMVVGNVENQTPELNSKINKIIVYPYWNVPNSIARKEILPKLKRTPNYLAKNSMKIYRNSIQINPYHVRWRRIKKNTFPYSIRQEPGPNNSLGILKFEFFNNYNVYVHDTPSKHLFDSDIRAFSHGCMRCEFPVKLGKLILDYDSISGRRNPITSDSLDSMLLKVENRQFILKDPIPIFVEYTSVCANRERIIFYLDIYKREEDFLKIMKE
jgi:murein L,D-transpeptidase YcbB/YkuD